MMSVEYEAETDALYIKIRDDVKVHHTMKITENCLIDFAINKDVIGVEVLNLKSFVSK